MQINTKFFSKFAVVAVAALAFNSAIVPAAYAENAPLGFQLMCLKNPSASECNGGGSAKVKVTTNVMATLKRVNAHVNGTISRYTMPPAPMCGLSAPRPAIVKITC